MANNNELSGMRKVYQLGSLKEDEADSDPLRQFEKWWQEAIEAKIDEPNAMTLATCSEEGQPSARIVLLKGINENGFVFYTNYESRKAREIRENSRVALVFFWKDLERQVRIEGQIKKVGSAESDDYFSKRPRESQIGAWSSPQSTEIRNAGILQENVKKYTEKFEGLTIPRPEFWGGYLVEPAQIEFWQGRPGRLHDRLLYNRSKNNQWEIHRLAP